eukprot:4715972-Amphidinium_carterae.1
MGTWKSFCQECMKRSASVAVLTLENFDFPPSDVLRSATVSYEKNGYCHTQQIVLLTKATFLGCILARIYYQLACACVCVCLDLAHQICSWNAVMVVHICWLCIPLQSIDSIQCD